MSERIALDAMGGDFGPQVVVPAAVNMAARHPGLELVLVGRQDMVEAELSRQRLADDVRQRLRVHHASEVVGMDEPPPQALRGKKDSSMRVAINLVKDGQADACVSAGNTGALMATARYVLKMLPGVDRPAIATALPTMTGHTYMLDLGANVDSSPEHLVQFAVMGSILAQAVDNLDAPRVGLLNIGEEAIKGNDIVRHAAEMILDAGINYIGFVEGDAIWSGRADVVVCDGFVGNVALKTSEGVARMISHFLRAEIRRNLLTRAMGLVALPVFSALKRRFDPRRYNGASLLGLNGIVVKSHGSADVYSFGHAIQETIKEVQKDVPARIRERVGVQLENRQRA